MTRPWPPRAVLLLLVLVLAACQAAPSPSPSIDTTDPRVTVGGPTTCAALDISDVRCTLLILRATAALETARPDHAAITGREIHAAGAPAAGASGVPASQVVPLVVVFTLADGTRIGVPVLCPSDPSGADQACNPQVE